MRVKSKNKGWADWPAVPLLILLAVATATASAAEITDDGIVNAIEDEILFDRAVPFNEIDVSSIDGIVTLTGTTDNILAKDRATELAETVKGVRAVVNRIQVKPDSAPTASELASEVDAALIADPATDSWEIDVIATEDGTVTLKGTVQSWQERELCTKVAKSTAGVTAVKNEIGIEFDQERPDYEIQPEIEESLRWNALVDHGLIRVEVEDGHVTLSGTVGSAAEKRRAEMDAWVAGVRDVDAENLEVARWARDEDLRQNKYVLKSDEAIRAAVEDAVLYDPRVMSFNVTPRVVSGRVTLHGIVDNAKAKQAATETAGNVVGVKEVRNYLKVRPVEKVDDDRIQRNVELAVARDALLDVAEIDVTVDDGTVYLFGTVDWSFERARAMDVAFRTKGVTDVHNYLEVRSAPMAWSTGSWMRLEPNMDYGASIARGNDQAIAESIESQIWWSPFVDSEDVQVEVRNGVAILTGTVNSWREYRAAAKNALDGGAYDVRNDLEVVSVVR